MKNNNAHTKVVASTNRSNRTQIGAIISTQKKTLTSAKRNNNTHKKTSINMKRRSSMQRGAVATSEKKQM